MTATDVVTRFIQALNKLRVPYMAVGSFSSNVYGKPRSTRDADFVAELGDVSVNVLAQELGPELMLEPQMSFETITATSRYRFRHPGTLFLIELFLLSDDAHDRERFARRVQGNIGGENAYVPTAEDVVIQKLRWSRQGQRAKDVEDARGVLAVQAGKLDLNYIRRWCDQHGTRELFEKLLEESKRFE